MPEDIILTLLIASVILSAVVAWAAGERGRSGVAWFFLSLLISPVLALLVLLAAGRRQAGTSAKTPGKVYCEPLEARAWREQKRREAIQRLPKRLE